MSYVRFILRHPRFVAYGFLLAFCSSFGQTFFIGLFGDDVRAAFGLEADDYGTCYSIATLASGLTIIWLGRKLDSIDLRWFTAFLFVGLAAACIIMWRTTTLVTLVLGLFMLRLFGQGLLSHTAMTSMARYYDVGRGKAISLAQLGHPAGEATLPVLAALVIGAIGWRLTWAHIALLAIVVTLPLAMLLLRGHGVRHRAHLAELDAAAAPASAAPGAAALPSLAGRHQWTRAEVVRDRRFYLLLPVVIASGFVVTGLFFHSGALVAAKGWTREGYAAAFGIFAGVQLPAGLVAGRLVDAIGARRLTMVFPLPLIAGLVVLATAPGPASGMAFMALAGTTSGLSGAILGSMWAELYGVRHLGAIRALVTAIGVFGTSASPALMGVLLARGLSLESTCWLFAGYAATATVLGGIAVRPRPHSVVD